MPAQLVYLVRHGETAWSLAGRHTSVTDLPLTANGRAAAARLAPALAAATAFALVLTSPLRRARETCEIAGLAGVAQIDPDLMEWQYGEYEGLTTLQIQERSPGWMLFADGARGGEAPMDVAARVDRLIARIREAQGDVALFAHGHLIRALAARWLGLPVDAGSRLLCDTASMSILTTSAGVSAVQLWNEVAKGSV